MLQHVPHTRVGLRDRALLLLGFAGGFRRSELVSLDHADLEFSPRGLVVTLRRAKNDQEGEGRRIGIPFGSSETTCPVRAVQAWLETARIGDGAVLPSRQGESHPLPLTDSGREPLDSSGSCHPTYGRTPNRQCTKRRGSCR
jgi:site-specific recombinase XerC